MGNDVINYDDDIWSLISEDKSYVQHSIFNFTRIKPTSLKRQFKDYFFNSLKVRNVAQSTLQRYSYALLRFMDFIEQEKLEISYFSDLTGDIIDRFIIYLKSTCKSASTMVLSFTALKQSVRYGQNLGLEMYPKREIFPMATSRIFQQEDTLKTRLFSDDVAIQIEDALTREQDIYLKTAVMIAYETGLRLSEILNLKENCVLTDFVDAPLLHAYSFKNDEERYVPITEKCDNQIKKLDEYTKDFQYDNCIFSKKYKYKSGSRIIYQHEIRDSLEMFLVKNNITDETGNIAYVIFHGFRHNVGTGYLNSGASADETRLSLGQKSLHSTNLYAKMKPKTLFEAYKKIGFIGVSESDLEENTTEGKDIIAEQKRIEGALPDGICLNAFQGETHCEKFNVCLLCSKFRTTVEDLPTHIKHLERLRADKERYMAEMSIGNIEYVEKIEVALETIIECLEAIKNE